MPALKDDDRQRKRSSCTEISLVLKPSVVTIPLLDTTALHAEVAVEFALSSAHSSDIR
jgi:aspartate/glutamate racemase